MWKKILLGFLGFIVIVVVLAMFMTSGMTESAETFFAQIKAGQYDQAYQSLSADFKGSTTQEQLIAFMKQTGLDRYQSASWGNRSFEGKQGKLEGSITTPDGSIPVVIKFTKTEKGGWQIYSIFKPESGLKTDKKETEPTHQKPDATSAIVLIKKTIKIFALGVKAKDFSLFYDTIAKVWQRQTTVSALEKAFKSYTEQNIDLTVLNDLDPVLEGNPTVNEKGILTVQGYYPTKPKRFYFTLGYYQEDGMWKLINIDTKIR
jgi:hypothetical protein